MKKEKFNFVKMHGTGNDYVYINCFDHFIDAPETLAIEVSDRHKGIGSDGLVLIMPSKTCDVRMRMFNADGSEAQMCGNASRCIGKFAFEHGLVDKKEMTLETKAGVKRLKLITNSDDIVEQVTVDMGEPTLNARDIPVNQTADKVIGYQLEAGGETCAITCVSMGNPHAVIFVDTVDSIDIFKGRAIETHPFFPEKTNVEYIERLSGEHLKMRVWERGSGETQACGTGACAALVAAVLNGVAGRKATVSLLGGDLEIEWRQADNHVYMTGNAVTVFEGCYIQK
ncbi:MAG: diaminopimelate epimerase [Prevotellaceae bacterium]|jgi:diaminopimelate epimerase|nr:diaminopimelate epimerase [Prevotellaceae bacterium]